MNIHRRHFVRRNRSGLGAPKSGEGGSVVIVFIALLAIMVILATANDRALFHLHHEIKALERQQIKRLDASQTNSVAVTRLESK
jgi:hypothetical protein